MLSRSEYRKIYKTILDALDNTPKERGELISYVTENTGLTNSEKNDRSTNSKLNVIRSTAGIIINEMVARGLISFSDGVYSQKETKPIALRIERCEEELIRLLRESPKTRTELKDALIGYFGTDETPTQRDDQKLFTYIGQILKRLTAEKLIGFDGATYSILPERAAALRDREAVLSIKADFLTTLHAKGGEFFEIYFMNLLAKYLVRCGKTVIESSTTGGSADGGIDGIAKTIDSLGFRETIMVQTKNKQDTTNETDVRGFYGAVCARQGSRGIFATTSDFHPVAQEFLDSIDNCVGVNGAKIFSMACDTSYGIRREGDKIIIDREVL